MFHLNMTQELVKKDSVGDLLGKAHNNVGEPVFINSVC
jgi:hypothetical protein